MIRPDGPQLDEQVLKFLQGMPEGRLLLFAHPGYEPCVELLNVILARFPGLQVTLLTHVTLTAVQQQTLPVEGIITFDKRARNRPTDLVKMALEKVKEVRAGQFDGLLAWYRGFHISPDLLFLETFGTLSAARTVCFWDDQTGRFMRHRTLMLLVRWPWTLIKLTGSVLFMFILWVLAALVSRLPARRRRKLSGAGPFTVAFLRTDIELALAPMDVGGSVSHVKGVIEGYLAAGHRVISFAPSPLAGLDPSQVQPRIIRYPLLADVPREILEALGGLTFVWQAYRQARADGVSLVYQRYSMNSLAGLLLARLLGVPLLLEANNSEVVMRRQFSRLTFKGLAATLERLILQRADAVVTVSERNREIFTSMGIPTDHIHVIPNAVNPDRFSPDLGDGGVRDQYGLHSRAVIGFVGLFYPWHGVSYLARAFVKVAAAVPEAHLLLVGDGDEREVVRGILLDANLGDRVTLTGMLPHSRVPEVLQAMDIVAAPHAPWKEFFGSPIKLFEYMSAGRAVVASDVGQMGQIIRHGENGLLVTAGDEDALAEALIRLCRDATLRKNLGSAARRDVLMHYTWEQAARRSLGLVTEEARTG